MLKGLWSVVIPMWISLYICLILMYLSYFDLYISCFYDTVIFSWPLTWRYTCMDRWQSWTLTITHAFSMFCDSYYYILSVKECLFSVLDELEYNSSFAVVETDSKSKVGSASVSWCWSSIIIEKGLDAMIMMLISLYIILSWLHHLSWLQHTAVLLR